VTQQLCRDLAELRVPRRHSRPRTTPEALRRDEVILSPDHRAQLRALGVQAITPEGADQIGHRRKKGSRDSQPVAFVAEAYKNR